MTRAASDRVALMIDAFVVLPLLLLCESKKRDPLVGTNIQSQPNGQPHHTREKKGSHGENP